MARPIPAATAPVLDNTGRFTPPWFNFLASRQAALQADLGASPTVEQISTAFNALIDALIAAGLMKET